jgi:hypothetical protein
VNEGESAPQAYPAFSNIEKGIGIRLRLRSYDFQAGGRRENPLISCWYLCPIRSASRRELRFQHSCLCDRENAFTVWRE